MPVIENEKGDQVPLEPLRGGECVLIVRSSTKLHKISFSATFHYQMLKSLANHSQFFYLDGYSRFF